MINYIIQVLLFQALFLAVYDFFLQKETFFKWNRVYLILTPLLSFLIPFLKFNTVQQNIPQEFIVQLPEVIINPEVIILQASTNVNETYNYLNLLFVIGAFIFLMIFFWKLKALVSLITSNKIIQKEGFKLVLVEDKQSAFSFFNYIFVHPSYLKKEDFKIIQHELIHSKHLHSLDLLFFEILKITMWFNPLIYVYQNRITVLHEYISDAEILKTSNKEHYFNQLLTETFHVENISFINQFYKHSLIKKRIIMITKEKSNSLKQLKYLLIIPLLVGMLIFSACTTESKFDSVELENTLSYKIPLNGKYFDAKFGKIFLGSHLEGEEINENQYTKEESEAASFIKNKKGLEFKIMIDRNGERVAFIKIPLPPPTPFNEQNEIDYTGKEDVPFAVIDEVPVFPGCEDNSDTKKCFQEKVTTHVSSNFNSKLADNLGLEPGLTRIFVMFTIQKDGIIGEIKARAPHKVLQEEAVRVINSLPKMQPGKHQGKAVNVKYALPIAFKVSGDNTTSKEENKKLNNVIYMVEGKEMAKSLVDKINADNIKSVNVLKGENAIEKYGEKGENGIIEIVLKK
ncbi:M56 family metallopeptidase [Lutibacter sp. TH_r2]|uniref:M56 family metallopeptidase n=1 Tax=Lutibacter sp. TH_r2 TaxID=3082083 RepID=UPI002953DB24|nr:M56 family metallopeptidase [Lutibacter sp. TH_r2]MDV7186020.1 M56 family metallopeptidase [Lutibacter sp. TH_r2]